MKKDILMSDEEIIDDILHKTIIEIEIKIFKSRDRKILNKELISFQRVYEEKIKNYPKRIRGIYLKKIEKILFNSKITSIKSTNDIINNIRTYNKMEFHFITKMLLYAQRYR